MVNGAGFHGIEVCKLDFSDFFVLLVHIRCLKHSYIPLLYERNELAKVRKVIFKGEEICCNRSAVTIYLCEDIFKYIFTTALSYTSLVSDLLNILKIEEKKKNYFYFTVISWKGLNRAVYRGRISPCYMRNIVVL